MDNTKPNSSWLKTFSIGFSIISFGITLAIVGYFILTTKQNQTPNQQPTTPSPTTFQPSPTPTSAADETANWRTYTSREGKFSFKHPGDWHFKTANYGANYNGARIVILFSNKLDVNGQIPSGVNIDRSAVSGILAIIRCNYASGCGDFWTTEAKFYDTKSPSWQGGGGPYPSIKEISLSKLGGKKAILIKSHADTNAPVYKGEYGIQYKVLLENKAKEHLTLGITYNSQNSDSNQILDTFDQILSTFQFSN